MTRLISFYLPQYHPVPENDDWWGVGFTEWHNVAKTKPRFFGHYQPHLPADLGFYDLRLPEARQAQADLAREYGIYGFCYYHYWFAGRRILERPFNDVLESGKPDFPFCLCWANENWSRAWDGGDKHILLEQQHSIEDDRIHIRTLLPAFADPRYIRIDGKPLFLVYRTELLPDPASTAEIWRDEARIAGIGEIYLARVEQFVSDIDPASIGFDAAVEFAPSGDYLGPLQFRGGLPALLTKLGVFPPAYQDDNVIPYATAASTFMNKLEPSFKRFHCVTPMWDNSARRKLNARILVGSTPELYEEWLRHTVARTQKAHQGDEQILFVNAWNEWAEGCHLEPDVESGRAYLEATRRALVVTEPNEVINSEVSTEDFKLPSPLHRLIWRISLALRKYKNIAKQISCPGKFTDK
ncbi:MAG: glycoside hydrolase family 99-like domain-containing protein [Pseudomonadota bacterium]|nr:glycoside hydrolase family 99-like domain-containing protein [Pseudomonadota bacterium]